MQKKLLYQIINLIVLISIYSFANAQYSNFHTKLDNYSQIITHFDNTSELSIDELLVLSQKIKLQEEFINTLQSELNSYDNNINQIESSIQKTTADLEIAKKQYSKLLVFTYITQTKYSLLIFILSADSFNQAYLRYKYLQIISRYLKIQAQSIFFFRKELEFQKKILQKEKNIRQIFKDAYNTQQTILSTDITFQLNSIKKLKQKSDNIRIMIEEYKLLREQLFSAIETNISETPDTENETISEAFKKMKGDFTLPLNNPIIISSYGEHTHPNLDNVKIKNDGVDITSHSDTLVKAIYRGKISTIISIPGYNQSILIKHGDYFSVYSNVKNIKVSVNDHIVKGQTLATVANSKQKSFPVLNFQIWHLTEKQNPMNWVK